MKSIIITKWIEPYKLLETIKEDYQYKDFTFDLFTRNDDFDILAKLERIFGFEQDDYIIEQDSITAPFDMVDLGKAEASIIIY